MSQFTGLIPCVVVFFKGAFFNLAGFLGFHVVAVEYTVVIAVKLIPVYILAGNLAQSFCRFQCGNTGSLTSAAEGFFVDVVSAVITLYTIMKLLGNRLTVTFHPEVSVSDLNSRSPDFIVRFMRLPPCLFQDITYFVLFCPPLQSVFLT